MVRRFREHLDPRRCLYCVKEREEGWPYRAYARFNWQGEELLVPLVFCSQKCSIDYERMRKREGSQYDPKLAGGFCVIELTAAVDFGAHYSFPGRNVFADAMAALAGARAGEVVETAALAQT